MILTITIDDVKDFLCSHKKFYVQGQSTGNKPNSVVRAAIESFIEKVKVCEIDDAAIEQAIEETTRCCRDDVTIEKCAANAIKSSGEDFAWAAGIDTDGFSAVITF